MLCICTLLTWAYAVQGFACSLDDITRSSTVGHPLHAQFQMRALNCCMSTLSLGFSTPMSLERSSESGFGDCPHALVITCLLGTLADMLHGPICRTWSKNSLCIYSVSITFPSFSCHGLLLAEHSSLRLLLLLPVFPCAGTGFKILSQHLCHLPWVAQQAQEQSCCCRSRSSEVRFYFPASDPLSISLLPFLSS